MSVSIESWRGKEYFIERYEQGKLMLHHISTFIQEKWRAEEDYQKRLEKIDKFNKTRVVTEHWTLGEGWNALDTFCSNEEKLRADYYRLLYELLASSNDLRKDLQNTKQLLTNEMNKWERGREKTYYEMIKSSQKYKSLSHELEQAKAVLSKQETGDSKKRDPIKLHQKVSSLEKEQDAASKQAKKCEQDYKNFLKKYQDGMKKILNNFSELDARRIICTRDLMTDLVSMSEGLYENLVNNIQVLKKSVYDIDERVDVNSWIQEGLSQNLANQFHPRHNYVMPQPDLEVPIDAVEAPQSPGGTKEDINLSPVSNLKIGTKIRRKGKVSIMAQKAPRSRTNSDPFISAINAIAAERGEFVVTTESPESRSDEENEQETATKEKEKEKKKNLFAKLQDQVSPRGASREKKKKDRIPSVEQIDFIANSSLEKSEQEPRRAVALYDYTAKDPTEISFKRGDTILHVIDQNNAEKNGIHLPNHYWLHGDLNGKVGLFPLNFVEVIFPRGTKVIVDYDFTAETEDEICLRTGEELSVISQSSDGWYRGRSETGDMGLFPQNYVHIKETSGG